MKISFETTCRTIESYVRDSNTSISTAQKALTIFLHQEFPGLHQQIKALDREDREIGGEGGYSWELKNRIRETLYELKEKPTIEISQKVRELKAYADSLMKTPISWQRKLIAISSRL